MASLGVYGIVRFVLRQSKSAARRGAAATIGFVPFALIGVGISSMIIPERAMRLENGLVGILVVLLAMFVGSLGGLMTGLLFMRFIERRDFGQIRK